MSSVGFPELEDTLAEAGSATEAAEAHGSLCGALCAASPYPLENWLGELLDDRNAHCEQCRHVLESVFAETRQALGGTGMEFAPLLPDDDQPLVGRASALAHWCQGFLYGLSSGRVASFDSLPGEASEIVRDITEITRASIGEDTTDTDEQAYAELVEFLRVGVQLIYEELEPVRAAGDLPPSPVLH